MKEVTSAGGVIVRNNNVQPEILLIRDLDYEDWFLPKGHVETGESLETTALREIEEETGLTDVNIIKLLGSFNRVADDSQELKHHHYFLILKTGQDIARPEPGKNWEVKWFNKDQLPIFYLPEQENIVRDNWEEIERLLAVN